MKLVKVVPDWNNLPNLYNEGIKSLCSDITNLGGNICGGFPLGLFFEDSYFDRPGDIDVYPRDKDSKKRVVNFLTNNGFRIERKSVAATTFIYVGRKSSLKYIIPIQVININCKDPVEIIKDFDLSVCQTILIPNDKILASEKAVEDWKDGALTVMNGWDRPIDLARRVSKYTEKGYELNSLDTVKLITLLHEKLGYEDSLRKLTDLTEFIRFCGSAKHSCGVFKEIEDDMYRQFILDWKRKIKELNTKYMSLQ